MRGVLPGNAGVVLLLVAAIGCSGRDGEGRGGQNGPQPVVRELRLDDAPVERRAGMLPSRPAPTVAEVLEVLEPLL